MTAPRGGPGVESLEWDEIGLMWEGLAYSPRAINAATREVTSRYNLGPRGAWMLNLISLSCVYPLDLAKVFKVGRSLITAELARLSEAGLILAEPGADRRRSRLALTSQGEATCRKTRLTMLTMARTRLAAYSADEVRLFAKMLHDIRQGSDETGSES